LVLRFESVAKTVETVQRILNIGSHIRFFGSPVQNSFMFGFAVQSAWGRNQSLSIDNFGTHSVEALASYQNRYI
jgi:hypothetical protein